MRYYILLLLGIVVMSFGFAVMPRAQSVQRETPTAATETLSENQTSADKDANSKKGFDPLQYDSILFTHWEHVAIQDARRYVGDTRNVTDSELAKDLKQREDIGEKIKPPPEEREIRLSGIVFHGKADWAIWLNEERITPDAIPKEVMDLRVYKEYIEFKWFDEYTNQIFPIRLRPHQRFNIDTRIFLPG